MGHVESGDVQAIDELLEFHSHFLSKLRVEIAERLVEQQYSGLVNQCPSQGDPLLLTPAQKRRGPIC